LPRPATAELGKMRATAEDPLWPANELLPERRALSFFR
jgi:hypothetical protein